MKRRSRRPEPKPWAFDWRNPDMLCVTRVLFQTPMGIEKREVIYLPEEMTEMVQESMADSANPERRQDPSYDWKRSGAPRRRPNR